MWQVSEQMREMFWWRCSFMCKRQAAKSYCSRKKSKQTSIRPKNKIYTLKSPSLHKSSLLAWVVFATYAEQITPSFKTHFWLHVYDTKYYQQISTSSLKLNTGWEWMETSEGLMMVRKSRHTGDFFLGVMLECRSLTFVVLAGRI